jgi:hypothetical protein
MQAFFYPTLAAPGWGTLDISLSSSEASANFAECLGEG